MSREISYPITNWTMDEAVFAVFTEANEHLSRHMDALDRLAAQDKAFVVEALNQGIQPSEVTVRQHRPEWLPVLSSQTTPTEAAAERPKERNPESPKLLYSRKEAASQLSISLRTVDKLVIYKEIQVQRVGRRVLFSRDALERFSRRHHSGAARPPASV